MKKLLLLPLLFLFGCSPQQDQQTITTNTGATATGIIQEVVYKDFQGERVSCGTQTGKVNFQSGYVIVYKWFSDYTKGYEETTEDYRNCIRLNKEYKYADMVDLHNKYR